MGRTSWEKEGCAQVFRLHDVKILLENLEYYLKNATENVSSASDAHGCRAPKVLRHIARWERGDGTSEVHDSAVRLKGLVIVLAVEVSVLSVSCCWEPAEQSMDYSQGACGFLKCCLDDAYSRGRYSDAGRSTHHHWANCGMLSTPPVHPPS